MCLKHGVWSRDIRPHLLQQQCANDINISRNCGSCCRFTSPLLIATCFQQHSMLVAYLTMTVIVHIISWTSRWFLWYVVSDTFDVHIVSRLLFLGLSLLRRDTDETTQLIISLVLSITCVGNRLEIGTCKVIRPGTTKRVRSSVKL